MPPDPTHPSPHPDPTSHPPLQPPLISLDETPAFAAPQSVPPTVTPPTPQPLLTPTLSPPRKCEGCEAPHPGTYGSGRFCSATCAKKVGARHKWAARASTLPGARVGRPAPARRAPSDAPCESCARLHDRSYGSGRFCSVHCARRVAATRKWEKSRSEKSKRLEAIRPAMLAPPSTALAGKRRRVVDAPLEQLHISDGVRPPQTHPVPQSRPQFYPPPLPPVPHPAPPPVSGVLSVGPGASVPASYLPPQPATPVHYQHGAGMRHAQTGVGGVQGLELPFVGPVVFTTPGQNGATGGQNGASLFYAHPSVPAYRVMHPSATATFSVVGQTGAPVHVAVGQGMQGVGHVRQGGVDYGDVGTVGVYGFVGGAFEGGVGGFEDAGRRRGRARLAVHDSDSHGMAMGVDVGPGNGAAEGSESAARALLCLRETNS